MGETNNSGKYIFAGVIFVLLFIALIIFWPFIIIDAGEKGVVTQFGALKGEVLDSGLHFRFPIVNTVHKMNVRTQAITVDELAYSKDAQIIQVQATINYALDGNSVKEIYSQVGDNIEGKILVPAVKEAIKATFANYTAQGVIDNRAKVNSDVYGSLGQRVGGRFMLISGVSITNLDFDDAYENAVKQKQVEAQNALKQENVTKQEEEKKKQEIFKAQALAEKTKLEALALQSAQGEKLIEKIYAEAALEAAKKWNGQLPTQMIPGGTLPFINVTR